MSEAFRFFRRGVRLGSWPLLQRYLVAPRVFKLPPKPVNSNGQHEFHFIAGKRHEIMLHWGVRSPIAVSVRYGVYLLA
jgi:hypothetical protein